jgi:TetR/AcrR family transcriptional regulator
MQKKKLSRREKEKLRQRKDMLAGALDLFSQKGYHNVSMHEIAKKTEFAIGTLYKFFKNKEDLYQSLVLEQQDSFHEIIMKAMEACEDEVAKLEAFILTKGRFFIANASMVRLYFAETRGSGFNVRSGLDSRIHEKHEVFLQQLAMVFKMGVKNKRFKKISNPYHLAVALESITNAFLFLWLELPERHPYPEDPNQILDILLKGLLTP